MVAHAGGTEIARSRRTRVDHQQITVQVDQRPDTPVARTRVIHNHHVGLSNWLRRGGFEASEFVAGMPRNQQEKPDADDPRANGDDPDEHHNQRRGNWHETEKPGRDERRQNDDDHGGIGPPRCAVVGPDEAGRRLNRP